MKKLLICAASALLVISTAAQADVFGGVEGSGTSASFHSTWGSNINMHGGMGGVFLGYDQQVGPNDAIFGHPIIVGAIVDAQWGSVKGSEENSFTFCDKWDCYNGTSTHEVKQAWKAGVKALVGVPVWDNRLLPYATIGYGLSGVDERYTDHYYGIYQDDFFGNNHVAGGVTYGAGISVALDEHHAYGLSLGYEHAHYGVGSSQSGLVGSPSYGSGMSVKSDTVTAALSVRL